MPDYLLWETGIIFRRPKARKSSNSHRILVFAEKSGIKGDFALSAALFQGQQVDFLGIHEFHGLAASPGHTGQGVFCHDHR